MALAQYHAIGRRKAAVARVYLRPGSGKITVNGQDATAYFQRESLMMMLRFPLTHTETGTVFDIVCNCDGGGKAGQAGAVQLGIARALLAYNPEMRGTLKSAGFLTRDARVKERKKYGQKGARARFQFSKR